ncbi:NUDIX hydrolase [Candidatus Gracilibacteria bacterium]|nr:NUDIX hydrolase [Candidatus Gracilibacteria bacterium]
MERVVRAFLRNDEGKYLLVRHKGKNYWSLPGGHIDEGESIYKAIKRECMEELQLKIKIIGNKIGLDVEHIKEKALPICIYKLKYNQFNGKQAKKLEYIFLSEIVSGNIIVQVSEIDEYKFFTIDEIIALENTYDQVRAIAKTLK